MADLGKPVLQKPPGYRDPSMAATMAKPPQKKPNFPPSFQNPRKPSRRNHTNRSCYFRLCCCIFLLLIAFFIVFSAAFGFCYLWYHPHLPSFRIENVTLPLFKITSRSDGTFLDATAMVKIQADNPNSKLGLFYRGIQGKISLGDEDGEVDLGMGFAAGFSLGRKNSTSVRFNASAKGVLVDDSVGERFRERFKNKDLRFTVEMRMNVGFIVSGKSTLKFPIRVQCDSVSLKQIGRNRTLPKCDIDFFNGLI